VKRNENVDKQYHSYGTTANYSSWSLKVDVIIQLNATQWHLQTRVYFASMPASI